MHAARMYKESLICSGFADRSRQVALSASTAWSMFVLQRMVNSRAGALEDVS